MKYLTTLLLSASLIWTPILHAQTVSKEQAAAAIQTLQNYVNQQTTPTTPTNPTNPTTGIPARGTVLAKEFAGFTPTADVSVAFGESLSKTYVVRLAKKGVQVSCGVQWAGSDPAPGIAKICISLGVDTIGTAPTNPTTPTDPTNPDPGTTPVVTAPDDITDSAGKVDPAKRLAMVNAVGTDGWVNYRYGKAATDTSGGTLFPMAGSIKTITRDQTDNNGQVGQTYIYGDVRRDGGPYSTGQSEAIGVGSGVNVVGMQTAGWTSNTGSLTPQGRWQEGFEVEARNIVKAKQAGVVNANSRPVCIASSVDTVEDDGPSRTVVYADGSIVTVGSNTAHNYITSKLPADFTPTACTMTSKGEYLVVVGWNKTKSVAQAQVVIGAGLPDGVSCEAAAAGRGYDHFGEWGGCYPGLPSQGNLAFLKPLGAVDLPDLALPTAVAAVTGMHPWEMSIEATGTAKNPSQTLNFPWSNSPISKWLGDLRQPKYQNAFPKGALMAVSSLTDGKVTLVDMAPTFKAVLAAYFGSSPTYKEAPSLTANAWPPTFDNGMARPVVVQTLNLGAKVADARFTGSNPALGGPQAKLGIATRDGKLAVYNVGGCVPGTKSGQTCNVSQIQKVGEVSGLGPVSALAQNWSEYTLNGAKMAGDDPTNSSWLFVSRGSREVGLVTFDKATGTNPRIARKYVPHASQCADPVGIQSIANYYNRANSENLACYNDQKVSAFRTGPLEPGGGWPTMRKVDLPAGSMVVFEGSMGVPMKPVRVLGANVP